MQRELTCRDAVLEAFDHLESRTDERAFRLKEIVSEVQRVTDRYTEHTIRTHVSSVMCSDAPVHHANHTDDLKRVSHGRYRRIVANPRAEINQSTRSVVAPKTEPSSTKDRTKPWHWEGNVQEVFVDHLRAEGWEIQSTSDTASREQGADIVARLGDRRLVVEVKGFPTDTYARGPRAGQHKPTNPATQARHWFAGALLTVALASDAHPSADVVMVFPAFDTYRSLVARTSRSLAAMKIAVYLVAEDGTAERITS